MSKSRNASLLLPLLALAAGCASIDGLFGKIPSPDRETAVAALAQQPVLDAIDPHRFVIGHPDQSVVGTLQVVFSREQDTLADIAREYGLGYDELIAANADVDPWLPGENTPIILPTQFVLPAVEREGIVLNIASKRLFYFPEDGIQRDADSGDVVSQVVMTFPIGIGRVGWETPIGATAVVSKAVNPSWWVPTSVRKEHAALGDPLPAVVPPGPDNPLGSRVLKLDMPGYLIHGTNQPYGVGMRVSHGCVRLYPENIELLYELVGIGETVRIVNEPYLLGRHDNYWYFESHEPLADDTVAAELRLASVIESAGDALTPHLADHIHTIASGASGLPVRIAEYDASEVFTRLRRVGNTVETNPNAPTLEEVREMMDAAVADAEF